MFTTCMLLVSVVARQGPASPCVWDNWCLPANMWMLGAGVVLCKGSSPAF